jgi:hypothetical protein
MAAADPRSSIRRRARHGDHLNPPAGILSRIIPAGQRPEWTPTRSWGDLQPGTGSVGWGNLTVEGGHQDRATGCVFTPIPPPALLGQLDLALASGGAAGKGRAGRCDRR